MAEADLKTEMAAAEELRLVKQARGRFVAMAGAYSLGCFNDNFFKQAVIFLAIAAGQEQLGGAAAALFAVPYLLFSAPAGWLADRFPKRNVVIGTKLVEIVAALCGAAGVLTGSWVLMLAMVFLMGVVACMFSPSLNGSIPELYPAGYVLKANARLKVVTTMAILGGMMLAGYALAQKAPFWQGVTVGHWLVAAGVMAAALTGSAASFGVARRPAANPGLAFPWAGPWSTIKRLVLIHRDPALAVILWTDAFIWALGALELLLISALGTSELGWSEAQAANLMFVVMAGTAVGGGLSSLAAGRRWHRVLVPALLVQAGMLLLLPWGLAALGTLGGLGKVPLYLLMLGLGIGGGLVLVPCESFIQVRPKPEEKGAVLSAGNFLVFCGIIVAGALVYANGAYFHAAPSVVLWSAAWACAIVALSLWFGLRKWLK